MLKLLDHKVYQVGLEIIYPIKLTQKQKTRL